MKKIIKSYIELTYNNNKSDITITPLHLWNSEERILTAKEISQGLDNDLTRLILSGYSMSGSNLAIARIKINAFENNFLSSIPYLSTAFKNNIKLKLKKTENKIYDTGRRPRNSKRHQRVISYIFDLIYSNNISTTSNGLIANLNYSIEELVQQNPKIHSVGFGRKIIKSNGDTRNITITGNRGAKFAIAVNENYCEKITHGSGASEFTEQKIEKVNDISILGPLTRKSKVIHNYGKEIDIIKSTIGTSGSYSFKQKFPSTIVEKTKVNGTMAASGATKIIFDRLANVRVGDRIYSSNILNSTVVKVTVLNPDGDNVNECTLDTSVTLADNAVVSFARKRFYSIDLINDRDFTSDFSTNVSKPIPLSDPQYRLTQYMNPIITLSHTITGSNFGITHNNGVATGLADGATYSLSFSGRPNIDASRLNTKNGFNNRVDVSLTIDGESSRTINACKALTSNAFSFSGGSDPLATGGNDFTITNFSHGALAAATMTFSYTFIINRFGTEDVTISVDLADIITTS